MTIEDVLAEAEEIVERKSKLYQNSNEQNGQLSYILIYCKYVYVTSNIVHWDDKIYILLYNPPTQTHSYCPM